jgi:hypothetical protein
MNVKDKRPPKRFSFQIGRENGRHYFFTSFFTRNRHPGQHGNILHGHNSYFLFKKGKIVPAPLPHPSF